MFGFTRRGCQTLNDGEYKLNNRKIIRIETGPEGAVTLKTGATTVTTK